MNYYEMNMECIKNNRRSFYSLLLEKNAQELTDINRLENIRCENAKNGEQILIIQYHSVEYRLNSIYRPSDEARRWAEQYSLQNLNNVIAMFGLGNGMFARTLTERMGTSDSLIIYEPCYAIFDYVLHQYDITDIIGNKQVFLAVEGINDDAFHIVLSSVISINNMKSLVQCNYPNYDKIFQESALRFYKELKDSYTSVKINVNTVIYFGEKHIDNTLNNLKFIKNSNTLPGIRENIPKGIPAVVVAAGPSVRDSIDLLKKMKGRAVIFAVDRILDYLLDSGVIPDFIVTIDAKKDIKYFSYKDNITIPLICYYDSNYDILEHHKGKKILCTHNLFAEEIYRRTGKASADLIPSGSVAIVAYSACVKLGFQRIILVGQDLAYIDGQSHAGSFNEEGNKQRDIFVEGIDGNQIKSRADWKEFVLRYQDLVRSNKDIEVIDAKQKGARIIGTTVMSLDEAYEKYCDQTFEPDTLLRDNDAIFSQNDIAIIKDYLASNLVTLKKIREKATVAVKECNKLLKYENMTNKPDAFHKSLQKLSKINKSVNSYTINSLLDSYITAKTADSLSEILLLTDNEHENNVSTFTKSKLIYKAVAEAADYTRTRLEDAINYID